MSSMARSQTISERTAQGGQADASEVTVPAKKNRSKPYLILGAVVALALVVYGVFAWLAHGKENTDDAQVDADVVTVSARVGGAVLKVHVTDNQQVNKGDLLVEID